jgi:hypothetical protein
MIIREIVRLKIGQKRVRTEKGGTIGQLQREGFLNFIDPSSTVIKST